MVGFLKAGCPVGRDILRRVPCASVRAAACRAPRQARSHSERAPPPQIQATAERSAPPCSRSARHQQTPALARSRTAPPPPTPCPSEPDRRPGVLAWMRAAHKLDSTLPLPHVSRSRCLRSQRDNLGWETWPEDILRHVCAAYLMAEWQDGGRVPAELGDSAGILLRHLRAAFRNSW